MKRETRNSILSALRVGLVLCVVLLGCDVSAFAQTESSVLAATNAKWKMDGKAAPSLVEACIHPYWLRPEKLTPARWIWAQPCVASDDESHTFSTAFSVTGTAFKVELDIAVDNYAFVKINGQQVGRVEGFSNKTTLDVSKYVQQGNNNQISIEVHNLPVGFPAGWSNPAGLMARLREATADVTCGPDVTRNVLAVLKKMRDDFVKVDPEVKERACDTLVSLTEGEDAWDIIELFSDAGEFPSQKNPQGLPSFGETLSGGTCCIPRYPCVKTVEFFGACHDMQVVNYAMWGMTRALCGRYLTINRQQWIADWARNRVIRNTPDRPDQLLMTNSGEKYGHEMDQILRYRELVSEGAKANRDEWEAFLHELTSSELERIESFRTDEEVTDPARFPELKKLMASADQNSTRIYKQCATNCMDKLTPAQLMKLQSLKFTYRWVGLNAVSMPRR